MDSLHFVQILQTLFRDLTFYEKDLQDLAHEETSGQQINSTRAFVCYRNAR